MAGEISSLGIGSGVLTADVVDKLKEADASRMVKPIEDKIELNKQKQDSYEVLSSLMNTFKSSTSSLSFDTLFDNKTVDVSGDAEVSVDAGANVESFTLETVTLAKKDITDFGEFDSRTDSLVGDGESGVLNLTIDGDTYGIDYDDETSLDDLAQAITEQAGDAISASILETSEGKYTLVLSSKTTGEDQAITIEDTDDGENGDGALDGKFDAYDEDNNPDGYVKIQEATDSEFKYNGTKVTRSTNEIDDLIVGVTIKLNKEGDNSNVKIDQDTTKITDEVQLFVDNYNSLMSNLRDMTVFDEENGVKGVFNGDSFVRGLTRDIATSVTTRIDNKSLLEYGIDIDRSGTMSFDKSVLESKLAEDSDSVKTFFSGGTNANGKEVDGFFSVLDDKVKSYTGYGKMLSSFDDSLKSEGSKLEDAREKAQKSLDTRYETMAKQFAAYDAMINQMNASFQSLQMMIDAQNNNK